MNSLIIEQSNLSTELVGTGVIDKLYRLALMSKVADANNDLTMSLRGNITAPAAYEDAVSYLRTKFPNLTINITDSNYYIRFEDSDVENICILNWGDGVGITKHQASIAAVGSVFSNNTDIEKFNEFLYFTSPGQLNETFKNCTELTEITMPAISLSLYSRWGYGDYSPFKNCTKLTKINWNGCSVSWQDVKSPNLYWGCSSLTWYDGILPNDINVVPGFRETAIEKAVFPEGVKYMYHQPFRGCRYIKYVELPTTMEEIDMSEMFRDSYSGSKCLVFKGTTPPSLHNTGFGYNNNVTIYVPDNNVSDYITTWGAQNSVFNSTLIKGISELPSTYRDWGTLADEGYFN